MTGLVGGVMKCESCFDLLDRAKDAFNLLTEDEKKLFVEWMGKE